MSASSEEPTRDQLLAMAYSDGELSIEGRQEFEDRMSHEPALGLEVSRYVTLAAVARQVAPTEPIDTEWARIEKDPMHRFTTGVGWLLFVGGGFGLGAWGSYEVLVSDMPLLPKCLVAAMIAGFLVLFLTTARARMRTLPYDPYRSIER